MPYVLLANREKLDNQINRIIKYLEEQHVFSRVEVRNVVNSIVRVQRHPETQALLAQLDMMGFNVGDINYSLSRIFGAMFNHSPKYITVNTIVDILEDISFEYSIKPPMDVRVGIRGVLRCIQLEFYLRVATPYEQEKIKENGDIKEYLKKKG